MARFDPQSAGLALMAGGLVLGGALAAATPTRMRPAPEPEWRIPSAPILTITSSDDSAPWFAANTYEVLPAIHRAATYAEAALLPAEARLPRSYGDDGDWRQIDADRIDADQVEVAGADEDAPILANEDDEAAPVDERADTPDITPPA
ncbi:hypothetical protein [Novosphingobium sp.]|uniref:hypothetical protein n=1 Tax=Novosphingobium sp. TaxID=1874826 RepID=UPI0038B8D14C